MQLSTALGAMKANGTAAAIEKEVIPSQPAPGQAQIPAGTLSTPGIGTSIAGRTAK